MLEEFKKFALRGNVMDLAVGVIIGGAFALITNSVVNDLVMPLAGIFFKADFTNLYLPLGEEVKQALAANPNLTLEEAKGMGPVFAWGNFVTVSINFIILAFIIFLLVRGIKSLERKEEARPTPSIEPTADVKLLTEIRDLLKK